MLLTKKQSISRKGTFGLMAVVLAIAYTLIGAVIVPISISTSNDIFFDGTVVPALLSYLAVIVELVAVAVAYAIFTFGIFTFSAGGFRVGILVFVGMTLYKYSLNMAADWFMNGSIPISWVLDIVNALYYTVLEFLPLLVVWFIIKHIATGRRAVGADGAAALEGEYPFPHGLGLNNPYLRAAFFCALVIVISKVFGRATNDIFSIVNYGLPEKALTWLLMALSYVLEAVRGLVCYIVIRITLSALVKHG